MKEGRKEKRKEKRKRGREERKSEEEKERKGNKGKKKKKGLLFALWLVDKKCVFYIMFLFCCQMAITFPSTLLSVFHF